MIRMKLDMMKRNGLLRRSSWMLFGSAFIMTGGMISSFVLMDENKRKNLLNDLKVFLVNKSLGGNIAMTDAKVANNTLVGRDKKGNGSVFSAVQYAANDPIEDRFRVERLDFGAWWFSCFDGHGGWQCSEYVHKELHQNIGVELANRLGFGHEENNMFGRGPKQTGDDSDDGDSSGTFDGTINERLVKDALVAAFERTDRIYKSKVLGAFEVGFGRDTRAGSCGLGALFIDGILFVANLGDSRAVLGIKPSGIKNNNSVSTSQKSSKLGEEDPTTSTSQMATNNSNNSPQKNEKKKAVINNDDDEVEDDAAAALVDAAFVCETPEEKKKRRAQEESKLVSVVRFLTGMKSEPSKLPQSDHLAVQVTFDHNCREKREQKKLEAEHPDEDDVVVCRPNRPDVCYIKGKLQPTRAFGDYYLKYSEFMRSPDQHSSAGRYIMPPYTPPYISSTPDITTLRLRRGVDDFIIIATDGLWDFLSCQEAVDVVAKSLRVDGGTTTDAVEALKKEVLEKAASKNNMTLTELMNLPAGRARRKRHDDLTILVVDLSALLDMYQFG